MCNETGMQNKNINFIGHDISKEIFDQSTFQIADSILVYSI